MFCKNSTAQAASTRSDSFFSLCWPLESMTQIASPCRTLAVHHLGWQGLEAKPESIGRFISEMPGSISLSLSDFLQDFLNHQTLFVLLRFQGIDLWFWWQGPRFELASATFEVSRKIFQTRWGSQECAFFRRIFRTWQGTLHPNFLCNFAGHLGPNCQSWAWSACKTARPHSS